MKLLGTLLVGAAFLAGAFLSSLDPATVAWNWMLPVLGAGAVGLWLHRRAAHAEASSGERVTGNMDTLGRCLDEILAGLEELEANKHDLPVYDARFEIDHRFRLQLNDFAEARESMIHVFGMQNYADVMSNFAAGERYINRIWSASTDGYVDEVNEYLDKALAQFTEALDHFNGLQAEFSGHTGQPVSS